jgi:hypothetical protein
MKTDITIPNSSCHPYEHKMSGIKYLVNRLHTYPITGKQRLQKRILLQTYYVITSMTNLIRKLPTQKKQKLNTHIDSQDQEKNKVGHLYV